MSYVLGVDGTRGGWIAIVGAVDSGSIIDAVAYASMGAVVRDHSQAEVIAVDMPIELGTGTPRRADEAARRFV